MKSTRGIRQKIRSIRIIFIHEGTILNKKNVQGLQHRKANGAALCDLQKESQT